MFRQVIANALNLANAISALPKTSQSQAIIQHASNFSDTEVPALQSFASACTSFLNSATPSVATMLKAIEGGATPESQKSALDNLISQIDGLDTLAVKSNTDLNSFRNTFNADCAELQTAVGQLRGQIAGLQARQSHYRQKAKELQSRINVMNVMVWVPFVGWIVKGASELASLITEHKSTEVALSDATSSLANVKAQEAQLNSSVVQAQQLQSLVGQLASGTQNVTNAVNMLKQQLDNEENFLNGVGDAPKLFLTAAQTSLQQLATQVS
ncbi:hypothetical protein O2N63_15950 [Aliiroseovarius sp. KMU-50]|uniref:Uncharacterized protein n=1 Tax=Aliiroseovarius salicola TaxID=3009082 RepID=A0ABT4W6R8_9RHOB|nr:hypothetical protein [Aliiroseovarius sp. KMU-50]MDA5095583.1 hypothetical protein [Aliiroseovarius sp. KMU-50]